MIILNKICLRGIGTVIFVLILIGVILLGCSSSDSHMPPGPPPDSTGRIPEVMVPDITIAAHGTKISQLIGDRDRERNQPTQNQTYSRYQLRSTDLGAPFRYDERTYLLFGDTHGAARQDGDAIAYATDTNPDDGLSLTFIHDSSGVYKPLTIPGISQGAFEVPMEGVSINGNMYIYQTTDHSAQVAMGRSIVARSDDEGNTFSNLYNLSAQHFINVSVVKVASSLWKSLPKDANGEGLVMFGSGSYRKSDVYLAWQPAAEIENPSAIQYFAGVDDNDNPLWSSTEGYAVPLFEQPCVGELSVSYNTYLKRWIMLYNCSSGSRGLNVIDMRTAKFPWGPWTKPQVIFDPENDGGWCHYIHESWQVQKCDSVQDPGRENVWGDVYGPYQFEHFATGDSTSTTIYFTMSTWNPYTVVLMKAELKYKKNKTRL